MDDKETAYAPFVDYEAKANGDAGIVEGYASVFGARDHGRDKVHPGAFTKTLVERKNNIIYLPSHDYKAHVKDIPGVPLDIKEDSKGLHTTTKFFLNTDAGRDSFTVIKAYQEAGRPLGMSYTFKPTAKGAVMTPEGRDLKELDLYEYGHTALPMLDLARTTSAKSDSNVMVHSDEVDHAHNHGDMIHSHPHSHAARTNGASYYDSYMAGHGGHDHTADQMKSAPLVQDESPKYWEDAFVGDAETKRTFTQEERDKLAKEGNAMSDGSYPIANEQDLKNAIQSVGRAKNYDAAKRHIISRARSLGKTAILPEDWNVNKAIVLLSFADSKDEALLTEFEAKIGKKLSTDTAGKIRAALAALQTLLTQEEDQENTEENAEGEKKKALSQKARDEIEEALARVRI